jgi:hypothetical protein
VPASKLTDDQIKLIETVVSTGDYIQALETLVNGKQLVDDNVLNQFAAISQRETTSKNYDAAAAIADLALQVSDAAHTETKIDLYIAAGQGFALSDRPKEAAWNYRHAVGLARSQNTIYRLPVALAMTAQLGDLSLKERISMLREAVEMAQRPESKTNDEDLWDLLGLYASFRRQVDNDDNATFESILRLVESTKLNAFHKRFANIAGLDNALLRERIRRNVILDDVDGEEVDHILNAIIERLSREPPGGEQTRPSTDVLMDRIIGKLPLRSMYTSLESLQNDLTGLSVLIHEFTHYWSMSGSLGGYLTELVTQLYVLRVTLDEFVKQRQGPAADDPEALGALHAFFEAGAKLQCMWLTWQPWMEGLAIFSEIDLDLTEASGEDLPLPVSMLLVALCCNA